MMTEGNWIIAPALAEAQLMNQINSNYRARIASGTLKAQDVRYVAALDLSAVKGTLSLSDIQVEKLRTLASAWDIQLRPAKLTSHRPFVGPPIVFAKKILYRFLAVLLKDLIRQQRLFNAAVISFLATSQVDLPPD